MKQVEMLQFMQSSHSQASARAEANVVRNDILAEHIAQSPQRDRTRQTNTSEACEACESSETGRRKQRGSCTKGWGCREGGSSIEFKRSTVFLFIGHRKATCGISPQAFEVSFVCLSLKAAAQLQTPLRNNRKLVFTA